MSRRSLLTEDVPELGHFIAGTFVVSDDREPILLRDPFTDAVLARVSDATPTFVDHAVSSSRRAFESGSWPGWSLRDRCDLLMELADVIEDDQVHLAQLEAADTGLPIRLVSEGHLPRVIDNLRFFAAAHHHARDQVVAHAGGFINRVTGIPIGVGAIITPWNSPSSITSLSLGACLVAGNTCIVKPSEVAPLSVAGIVLKLARLGLPPGVVNLVHGGPEAARALAGHPGVDAISFTGSRASGIEVATLAARRLARVSLELGGVSHAVVLSGADLSTTVEGLMWSAFACNGAACITTSGILAHTTVVDALCERLAERIDQLRLGDPLDGSTDIGPLPRQGIKDRLDEQRSHFLAQGFVELCTREVPDELVTSGRFFAPSLLRAPAGCTSISADELTGPMSLISAFEDADQVTDRLNEQSSGLAASVWGPASEQTRRVAERLRFGSVTVNSPLLRDARTPFGGLRRSGLGRVGGNDWLRFWCETKSTTLPR